MSDGNKVIMIGRFTKDPDLRSTQNGTSVASFSIANNRAYVSNGQKKDIVGYFNCVAWAKLGEVIAEYCKKGHRIYIEGRLQQRSWEDSEGLKRSAVEIVVEAFQFLENKGGTYDKGSDVSAENNGGSTGSNTAGPVDGSPFSDDDIPF